MQVFGIEILKTDRGSIRLRKIAAQGRLLREFEKVQHEIPGGGVVDVVKRLWRKRRKKRYKHKSVFL